MNMREEITWHPASQPPDNDREVLAADEPKTETVILSYRPDSGDWYSDGAWTDAPAYWAEFPKGPQKYVDCPHAEPPFRFCDGCKVSPCPIGLDAELPRGPQA